MVNFMDIFSDIFWVHHLKAFKNYNILVWIPLVQVHHLSLCPILVRLFFQLFKSLFQLTFFTTLGTKTLDSLLSTFHKVSF